MGQLFKTDSISEVCIRVKSVHRFISLFVAEFNIDTVLLCSLLSLPHSNFERKLKNNQFKSYELMSILKRFLKVYPDYTSEIEKQLLEVDNFKNIQIGLVDAFKFYMLRRKNIAYEIGMPIGTFNRYLVTCDFNCLQVQKIAQAIDHLIENFQRDFETKLNLCASS